MNEFMNILFFLIVMVLLMSQIYAIESKDRALEFRKPLFSSDKYRMSKRTSKLDDVKFFETISEGVSSTSTERILPPAKRRNSNVTGDVNNYGELKTLLTKLLNKIGDMEKDSKRDTDETKIREIQPTTEFSSEDLTERTSTTAPAYYANRKRKAKDSARKTKNQRWGKWTNWSPCSVSCGKGREIRWRHCLENCDVAETEMEEKTCQLPACGPTKLFGVIKL